MEEHVGQLWHKLISRAAATDYPAAAVSLDEMGTLCGVAFRAMGGDGGLQIAASHAIEHGARRGLLQRIAGSGKYVEYGWRDRERLYLPQRVALFSERERNRELYLWLVALAAAGGDPPGDWRRRSGRQTQIVLNRFPGLKRRYRGLVEAHLALRPPVESLPPADQPLERAIRATLIDPADDREVIEWRDAELLPVPIWLHPDPPLIAEAVPIGRDGDDASPTATPNKPRQKRRRKAERVEMPDGKSGLLLFRLESLFSWTEYLPLDRTTEESEDDEQAEKAADDLDVMSVARSPETIAGTLRFDLDLPSEANDDIALGEGIPLPEWDYKRQQLRPDHCRLQPMLARASGECELPAHLTGTARRIRAQFEQLLPDRRWFNGEREGNEFDLDGYITHLTDRINGHDAPEIGLYRNVRHGSRDMATLLLADLSLSTDSWVNNDARVIDIIRDSIFLFAEALAATGDRFAIHGFSSRRRDPIRFHTIKTFDEAYDGAIRGRIAALEPGYYTRMGAAIRYATRLFTPLPSAHKVLLLLTDGKPNDLDQYEGRYGIEDTRMAIQEALRASLHPFCVTIDDEAEAYLPYLFGASSYVLIRKADELPRKLLLLYARLTHGE